MKFPPKLKRHLGLDDRPSWIYTDEINVFLWPQDLTSGLPNTFRSPVARETCVIGALPSDWFKQVTSHLAESYRMGSAKTIRRTQ